MSKFDKIFWGAMAALSLLVTLALSTCVHAQVIGPNALDPLHDLRYCGAPKRNADGSIKRSSAVLTAFQRQHPCPSTGQVKGACPGWQADHVIPLAACGCDTVWNLQWLPVEIKTCSGKVCKDRWERVVNKCRNLDGSPNVSGLPLPLFAASSALASSEPAQ